MPTPGKGVTDYKRTEEFMPEERDVLMDQNGPTADAELIASETPADIASVKKLTNNRHYYFDFWNQNLNGRTEKPNNS